MNVFYSAQWKKTAWAPKLIEYGKKTLILPWPLGDYLGTPLSRWLTFSHGHAGWRITRLANKKINLKIEKLIFENLDTMSRDTN